MQYLYHYYERERGPFRCLADLPLEQAQEEFEALRKQGDAFAIHYGSRYPKYRRDIEARMAQAFREKGGYPIRTAPYYMTVGLCGYMATLYNNPEYVRINVAEFNPLNLSFTYGEVLEGDLPRPTDATERRIEIYTLEEIQQIISKRGLPQVWNEHGRHGRERYIEAQIWSDQPIDQYRK